MTERDDGFSPIFDDVVREVGLVGAAVFGCVWRHEQMHDHVCKAAVGTMGKLLGLNERTVRRHLKDLVERGMIYYVQYATQQKPAHYLCAFKPVVSHKFRVDFVSYLDR